MKNLVGSLDIDNNMEKQSELAEIISVKSSLKLKREKDLSFWDFYIVQVGVVVVVDEFNL